MRTVNEAMTFYKNILNEFPTFTLGPAENNFFQLQDAQEKSLIKLENDFNVTAIAIGKSDFEKTFSLMAYVHQELFFPGDNISPAENNTYEIMKVRKTGALFCSFHATVLAEMLLSIGIKAIKTSCLPKDFDGDMHVAVLAYMKEMKKWVFFDPTFNTCFFDEAGNPLSMMEIREQYRNQKEVCFKSIEIDKQWTLVMNGIVCETYNEWYKIYMAKNCFRFMFPQQSAFNDSDRDEEYIFTNPPGYKAKNEYDTIAAASHVKYMDHFCFV